MAEKEEKLINLLEQRQEDAVRRVASYSTNRADSAASHSATSMSSNNSSNSMTAG